MPPTRASDSGLGSGWGLPSDWGLVLSARDRFVAVASAAGPHAPTLCAGWTVRHLVGHLLTLHDDPLSWPGIALPRLASLTERRMARATASGFSDALDRLARQSPFMPMVFETPRSRWAHHLGEYVVHTEDILRANALPTNDLPTNALPATELDPATTERIWARVQVAARQLHRARGIGLVLERSDVAPPEAATGDHAPATRVRVLPGARTEHVIGTPLELLIWAHRGDAVADVCRVTST